MRNIRKKLAMLLTAALLLTAMMPMTAWADEGAPQEVKEAIEATDEYLKDAQDDAWAVFARGRNLDADHTEDYFVDYYEGLDTSSLVTAGDCAKTLLALRASGRGDSEKAQEIKTKLTDWTNNEEWLKSDPYSVPVIIESLSGEISDTEKDGLVNSISGAISSRYDLWGYGADVDSTAMAAAALTTVSGHDTELNDIFSWISANQDTDGNIMGAWGKSPETTSQVIVALAEQDKVDDSAFVNSGKSTVDGLMSYYDSESKSFASAYNPVITAEQANYALVAYDRSKTDGAASLFDFSDVTAVYYFSFDGSGASNTMKTQAILSGDTKKLSPNAFVNSGYRFIGWKDASGKTYSDEQAVKASKDTVLYAVWEKVDSDNSSNNSNDSSNNSNNSSNSSAEESVFSYINLNPYYEDSMKVKSLNAVLGEWKLSESGNWTFFIDGVQVKGRWVTAVNPAAGKNKAGWFYFDENGNMLTGWQQIRDNDGIERWYYLNPHHDVWFGACFRNTQTPDGYYVDETGAWMDPNAVTQEEIQKVADKVENASTDSGSSSSGGSEQNAKKITVSVSVSGNVVSGSEEVTIKKNASAYEALKELAKKMGWNVSGGSSYVKGIGGEMEKSAGATSGWTYSVNGDTPNKSAGSYKLKDGDSVDWTFVDGPEF